ncbi:nicotinamide riboside transporter PnuC [Zhihengliuella salsuginis]|uniref:Membrane protein n=1 Tax=Zhihengliuella salsuginis TaxID=578222 RepID=A0ABQ3GC59_9MICC|nr:nicotinamide riboside transporter PnuC [Zhihengliuella salsuginis]GHD01357.1 membrane protein [Zhihengliuella salsuginis]
MDALRWLIEIFNAYLPVGGGGLLVREVVGNAFGLASALGGMRRKIWAWPVGIIGNALLLTVFLGSIFGDDGSANLLGQAGRQVMFIAVAVYGWRQWRAARAEQAGHDDGSAAGHAVTPRWATGPQRLGLAAALIVGTVALTPVFTALGSYEPVWADAWTFVGSLLATYGMAKGWVEFWLVWVAVDIVGVPLLFSAGYYATAFMYLFYGVFTLVGFFVWWRAKVQEKPRVETRLPDPRVQQAGSRESAAAAERGTE